MNNGRILTEEVIEELLNGSEIDFDIINSFFHGENTSTIKSIKLGQEEDFDLGDGIYEKSYFIEYKEGNRYGNVDPVEKEEIEKFIQLLNN